jgi:CAAX amino terminal protease family.
VNSKLKFLIALTLIFVLNDFAFIPVKSYVGWLAIDYSFRILALAVIFFLIWSKRCALSDFGLVKMRVRPFIIWAVVLSVTGIFIDRFGWQFFKSVLPQTGILHFPASDNSFAKFFDLTVGVALVSISEEAIFRGYYASVLGGYFKNPAVLVTVSCLLFGLIHWSGGLHAILATAIWGILPMVSVLRTGSILPAVVAHWATDFVYFLK